MTEHGFYNGFRAVHLVMDQTVLGPCHKIVTVIPRACFLEIHAVFVSEYLDFFLCEAEIFRHIIRIGHRILTEHIQSGMGSVFLDRQNPGHIRKRDIILIFSHVRRKSRYVF